MPKIDWSAMGFTYFESEGFWAEAWKDKCAEQRAYETGLAWDRWIMSSCVESNGGHAWWLDIDPEDGLDLHCRHCPAGMDEIYPDGNDLVYAELPLPDGTKLVLDCGMLPLEGPQAEAEWHGPVKAWVESEKHYSWEYGAYEYDAWVIVEALLWISGATSSSGRRTGSTRS